MILLNQDEIGTALASVPDDWWVDCKITPQLAISKAQLKKVGDVIGDILGEPDENLRLALSYMQQTILRECE